LLALRRNSGIFPPRRPSVPRHILSPPPVGVSEVGRSRCDEPPSAIAPVLRRLTAERTGSSFRSATTTVSSSEVAREIEHLRLDLRAIGHGNSTRLRGRRQMRLVT